MGNGAGPGRETTTRELILDAAERRFAQSGFAGVAVREIAADAGLKNQASLYHHFKNKQAIYEAALERGVEPLVALMADYAAVQAGADGRVVLDPATLVERMLDYLAERPNLPRLIQRAGLDDSRLLFRAVSRLLRPLYTQGVELLARSCGPWQRDEIPHIAAGFYHLLFGYFANAALLEAVLDEDPGTPAAVARQREFLKSAAERLLGAAVPRPA